MSKDDLMSKLRNWYKENDWEIFFISKIALGAVALIVAIILLVKAETKAMEEISKCMYPKIKEGMHYEEAHTVCRNKPNKVRFLKEYEEKYTGND